jgi:hypothetical protein
VLGSALQNQVQPSLVKACLRALNAYLGWIPLQFIFDTDMIDNLIAHFIVPIASRNEAIKCFTEVACLTFDELPQQDAQKCKFKLMGFYCSFIQRIMELTKNRSLKDEFESVRNTGSQAGFENFARQLALAISAVIKN